MVDARGQRVQLQVTAETTAGQRATLSASGLTISFPGFLRAYVEGSDDPDAELDNRERRLPTMEEGQSLQGNRFTPASHSTQAPARFTEASLVKRLEDLGVGRPSTYASIIRTIVERGYVWKKKTALVPTFKAFAVVGLLEKHFAVLVDYAFTARMEDELDQIAQGETESVPWLERFYFGAKKGGGAGLNGSSSARGLRDMVVQELEQIDAREINTLPLGTDPEGRQIDVRVGRYGPYLQRGEETASVPEDLPPDELTIERAIELLEAPSGDRQLGKDPESGLPVLLRQGRFGAYVQLGEAGEDKDKPKTQSLFRTMEAADVTLQDALRLLALPRIIGQDDAGVEIQAHYGRYGAYVMRGSDRRSLETDDQVFTADVKTALDLLAQPPKRGRRTVVPLRELGNDPVSEKLITLRSGRFGHYVTDGETNASLRTGDTVDGITPERAQELLQLRRDRGPSVKKKKKATKKKATKKKATKKKTSAKKTATKKTSKKKTSKKKASKKTAQVSSPGRSPSRPGTVL